MCLRSMAARWRSLPVRGLRVTSCPEEVMPNLRVLGPCLAALLLATPAPASSGVRPWLSGAIGGSTYAMSDVNDDVGFINTALGGTGLRMGEVTAGFNYGAAIGLDVWRGFAVGLGYDRLAGHSDVAGYGLSVEYDLPADLLRGFGRYSFKSAGKSNGFLEASLGRVKSAASTTFAVPGLGTETSDLEGTSLAYEAAGGISAWTAPQFAITVMVGYRHATIGDVEVDGERIYDQSGGDYTIDYNGMFARLGILVALTK
jgi:hypothetical protein